MHPLIESNRQELEELCRRHHVSRLWVFGSATREDFDPARSDVDFLVEFGPAHRGGGLHGEYFQLMAALEKTLGRHVDLVEVTAIRNPYFRREAEQTRIPLYAA